MKTIEKIKKYTYGTILTIGSIKSPGFKPRDKYFIDKNTYLFGKVITSKRIWNLHEIINKPINTIGFKINKSTLQ